MSSLTEVKNILVHVLQLDDGTNQLTRDSFLLGSMTELDSITVAGVIMEIEDHFEIVFDHAELNGRVFATLGSLTDLVDRKLSEKQP